MEATYQEYEIYFRNKLEKMTNIELAMRYNQEIGHCYIGMFRQAFLFELRHQFEIRKIDISSFANETGMAFKHLAFLKGNKMLHLDQLSKEDLLKLIMCHLHVAPDFDDASPVMLDAVDKENAWYRSANKSHERVSSKQLLTHWKYQ